jgi:hypothetical protein
MADKSIFELTLQTTFASNDRLVVGNYANSDAEAITGQTLVNLLATSLDGHGGIQSIVKTSSTGTDPVVDTYTITMADTTTTTFTVTNGLKGDTGLQTFIYFRWAHVQPSSWSDTTSQPDEWMGVYAGTATTPPTTVSAYTWVNVRGETGETGEAASISSQSVTYMESTSGTIVPSGSWSENVPSVTPGNFLWTRTQLNFNDGSTVTSYSVSRYGIDGTGAVSSVNGQSPDINGNVALTANNVPTADNLSIQAHLTAAEDDIDTLQSDMTTAQAAISKNTQFSKWVTFTAAGTQTISDPRFTADYILDDYQFFSGSTATSDVLADMTVETSAGQATVAITTVYSNGTVRLDFAYSEGSGTQS